MILIRFLIACALLAGCAREAEQVDAAQLRSIVAAAQAADATICAGFYDDEFVGLDGGVELSLSDAGATRLRPKTCRTRQLNDACQGDFIAVGEYRRWTFYFLHDRDRENPQLLSRCRSARSIDPGWASKSTFNPAE